MVDVLPPFFLALSHHPPPKAPLPASSVVIMPCYRGTLGYGDAWAQGSIGKHEFIEVPTHGWFLLTPFSLSLPHRLPSPIAHHTRYPYRHLLKAGYKVFMPCYRGTLGYGDAWAQGNIKKQGFIEGGDLGDILDGIDHLRQSERVNCGAQVCESAL